MSRPRKKKNIGMMWLGILIVTFLLYFTAGQTVAFLFLVGFVLGWIS